MKHLFIFAKSTTRGPLLALICWIAAVPTARADLTVLPGVFSYLNQNNRFLSGDGKVAVLCKDENGALTTRWTAETGAEKLPLPPGGNYWTGFYCHLSTDGSEIVGLGGMNQFGVYYPWIWRQNHGTRVYSAHGDEQLIGISSDGDYIARIVQTSPEKVYQDFTTSGTTALWAEGSGWMFNGTSYDNRVLFGRTKATNYRPCYWSMSGQQVIATSILKTPAECTLSGKDGSILLGQIHTGQFLPNDGPEAMETFRWNTITGQIEYFFPPHFLTAEPSFISPNGKMISIAGYYNDTMHFKYMVYDSTTAGEAGLGMQEVDTWLIAHQYIVPAEAQGRSSFEIISMSDDLSVVAGNFIDAGGKLRGFLAKKLRLIPEPEPTPVFGRQ